ncbi:MAG TPA: NAD(P)H-binding protein [Jatrophihabitantaceae bacterium]
MSKVLVTGGTGRLGRLLVPELGAREHDVRVLSRTAGAGRVVADLADGTGLDAALRGAQVVVHAATSGRIKAVDIDGTERLAAAAARAGVEHLVYASIVGVDANPLRYYRAKLAAEVLVSRSGLAHTLARGTQFYDLVAAVAERLRIGPVLLAPTGWRLQPSDPADFARHLADRVDAGPADGITEFGGPQEATFAELAEAWHRAKGRSGRIRNIHVPGQASAAFRAGAQVVAANALLGARTWPDWLQARLAS